MKIAELWQQGMQNDRDQHLAKEQAKLGNLRAGDSGAMLQNGDVIGGCHRRAYVRTQLGIEVDPPSPSTSIMFELGKANESIWVDKLSRSWKGKIKQEEEIPIKWSTSHGVNVTGRPDVVLCDENEKPVIGLELKAACSLWTSREVSFEREPKTKHILQATHYAWQLNIPYRLVYSQYVNYAMPDFAKKFFPTDDVRVDLNDKGQVKAILPHHTIFEINVTPSLVFYRMEGQDGGWSSTNFGYEDIQRYYEFVAIMDKKETLGPRPKSVKPNGKPMSYDECNYCPLLEHCNKYEHSFKEWTNAIKRLER